MIAKPKDLLFFAYMTILGVVAFAYGIATVPSPSEQKNLKLDFQRVTDIAGLSQGIDWYYQENNKLPSSLNNLTSTYKKYMNDPETENTYEYKQNGSTSYILCATFATDSSKTKGNSNDRYTYPDYTFTGSNGKFDHPKGHKCFDFNLPEYLLVAPTVKKYPTIKTNSTASAKLSSVTKTGNCKWEIYIALKGFSPNSPLTQKTKGEKTQGCDTDTMHEFGFTAESAYTTETDGTALVGYTRKDYGTYTYTFIDQEGNHASVTVEYSLTPTPTP